MDVLVAGAVGLVIGWLLGRSRSPSADVVEPTADTRRRPPKPTKRQREILAVMPPDPSPPSIAELMREEAAETGVDRIPDPGLPLHVRLRVWHRDRPGLPDCADDRLRFVVDEPLELPADHPIDRLIDAPLDGDAADLIGARQVDDRVRLVCIDDDAPAPEGTSTS